MRSHDRNDWTGLTRDEVRAHRGHERVVVENMQGRKMRKKGQRLRVWLKRNYYRQTNQEEKTIVVGAVVARKKIGTHRQTRSRPASTKGAAINAFHPALTGYYFSAWC